MNAVVWALAAAALGGTGIWLVVLLDRAGAGDLRPTTEDQPPAAPPATWPRVAVVVPARDETEVLPETLPTLLAQDYPGPWSVVLVDDRSRDGTAALARDVAAGDRRLEVVEGEPLPAGWIGKVWALEQGCARAFATGARPAYVLFTDADIRHEPGSLRDLVAESSAERVALNSRMARLRTLTRAERLLIPPFVFFFNLLYPMRRVNEPGDRTAAAAGGCMLIRTEALERAGGPSAIRDEVIDDVNLARRVKALGEPIRLATSRRRVVSIRPYGSVGAVWRMVRRTAFDQLRYSWSLLAGTVAVLVVAFVAPPASLGVGLWGLASGSSLGPSVAAAAAGVAGWATMTASYRHAVRFFELSPAWTLTLPLAGVLYGAMTVDSARRGRRQAW